METPIALPFVFWNKSSPEPEHKITCLQITTKYIVTGSETGELCIWEKSEKTFTPRTICTTGKVSKCLDLSFANGPIPELVGTETSIVSLHSDNKIRVWDIKDGRCTSSSSSSLLPNYIFNHIITIGGSFDSNGDSFGISKENLRPKQLVAVSGEWCEILLVDLWSMERISAFCMSGPVVKIVSHSFESLWAIDSKGSLRQFSLPVIENYFFDIRNLPEIASEPKVVYNTKEEAQDLVISSNEETFIVKIKHGLRVYLRTWILDDINEYAHIEEPEICKVFCGSAITIILKDSLMTFDISKVAKKLVGLKRTLFTRSNSLTSIKVHSLDNELKKTSSKIDPSFIISQAHDGSLYGFKDSTLYEYNIHQDSGHKILWSFKTMSFHNFADMTVQHLLKANETITCSLTYLTSEWPLYVIGTSIGRIFVCPFHPLQSIQCYQHHQAAISCIYIKADKMVSCCKNHSMCLWEIETGPSLTIQDDTPNRDKYKRRSVQFNFSATASKKELKCHTPIKTLEFYFGSISKIIRVEGIRDEKPFESTDLLLGQSKDFSIILVSLTLGQILSFFAPISGNVKEAYLLNSMDYLYVLSENEQLYIFNNESNSLERIMEGNDIYILIRKPIRTRSATETFSEVVEETSAKQRVTMFNLRQLFPYSTTAALKVSTISIGNLQVPLLLINIMQIVKKMSAVERPSIQLEYLLSLLTCWSFGCKAHESMVESIKELMKLAIPVIKANIGTIGVDNAMSFSLPSERSSFEVSAYTTALVMSAGYSLLDALARFVNSKVKKTSRVVTAHLISQAHENDAFQVPFLPVLALQALSGVTTSRYILQDNISFLDLKHKQRFLKIIGGFIEEQWSLWEHLHNKGINRSYVGLMEALCATLLGNAAIELKQTKKETTPLILNSLRCMLKTDIEGFIISAANILGKGMRFWRLELTAEQVKDIVKELLLYGCKDGQKYKNVFYKAIINIALSDFLNFIEILTQEIENMEIDPNYPAACVKVLDMFIEKKYEEIVSFLPAVVELIVRTLNPHNPMLRKTTMDKASHTLKTLILRLPNVAFCQTKQRLAIGTIDNLIVIYDLKTASQWKILKGHSGPVCAVEFEKNGNFLASYSTIDCTVKIWKLKTGFIQDLIGSHSGQAIKSFQLEIMSTSQSNYRKFLDTVRLSWAQDDRIYLTREDANKYLIKV